MAIERTPENASVSQTLSSAPNLSSSAHSVNSSLSTSVDRLTETSSRINRTLRRLQNLQSTTGAALSEITHEIKQLLTKPQPSGTRNKVKLLSHNAFTNALILGGVFTCAALLLWTGRLLFII